jgi:hypothetical protein
LLIVALKRFARFNYNKKTSNFRFLGNHPNFKKKKGVLFGTGQSGYLSVIQRIMKRAINFMGNFQGGKRSPV